MVIKSNGRAVGSLVRSFGSGVCLIRCWAQGGNISVYPVDFGYRLVCPE